MQNFPTPVEGLPALNDAQCRAVQHLDGPMLVLAGAGTGKTRVLTHRVVRILDTTNTPAYRLLCVTFTNKAAQEMGERIAHLSSGRSEGIWLGTFHSLGARVLRKHGSGIGLAQDFTIVDSDDQHRILRQILQDMRLDPKEIRPGKVMPYLQGWKDRALEPDRVPDAERHDSLDGLAMEIYERYQRRLQSLNACDFGDLLMYNIKLFAYQPDVLAHYQERFRYVLVDEYQDTNVVQNLWLSLLAHQHRQLCCVGDDDQSIYGWRGAEIRNILEFQERFPEAEIVRLEENYRSTQNILGCAAGVIRHNSQRLGKEMRATRGAGAAVRLLGFWDSRAEAQAIADEIRRREMLGEGYENQAVLIRAGHVSQMLETTFAHAGIPYRIYGGMRFYEREEIRDAVAYLRLIKNREDELAFDRIINKPARGIGQVSLDKVAAFAEKHERGRLDAARRMLEDHLLSGKAAKGFSAFLQLYDHWQQRMEVLSAQDLLHEVLGEAGIFQFWKASGKIEAETRLENLGELLSAIAEFSSLEAFLEHVALVMDDDRERAGREVSIMTMHAAKGLEFDDVFLPAWEEGIFPNPRALDEDEQGSRKLEEERRLAYVAMTRARSRLQISFACERLMHGQVKDTGPSRFLKELPEENLERSFAEVMAQFSVARRAFDSAHRPVADPRGRRQSMNVQQSYRAQSSGRRKSEQGLSDALGCRVVHQSFGKGTITQQELQYYVIEFDEHGQKKITKDFVKLIN